MIMIKKNLTLLQTFLLSLLIHSSHYWFDRDLFFNFSKTGNPTLFNLVGPFYGFENIIRKTYINVSKHRTEYIYTL